MRPVTEAEAYWSQLDDFHSLTDFKIHVSSHTQPRITAGLRSVCWKIFLLFHTLDRSSWPSHLRQVRNTYQSLRTHYLRAIHSPNEFESSVDPLSDIHESPWVALRADEDLRAEIFQDVQRCMPDNVYFRQPATQDMMLDILFVWCKLHPTIGYRQGMHEILAPLLWVVERDAIASTTPGLDPILAEMLDAKYIEHDTYTLFALIMQIAKSYYAPAESALAPQNTPMLQQSSIIFDIHLPKVDPELHAHLTKLEIVPQIFLLRWIRLLFGREFPLDDVLDLWDALFAIDARLDLVDLISVSMLLRIRWELLAADTNEAFALVLRYPKPAAPAFTLIKDALHLRDHLDAKGGAEVITRYGKPAPAMDHDPLSRVSSPSPSFGVSRPQNTISPRHFISQPGAGIEALLQGAAKNVLERGSQWGVSKALREALGEVRKNVEAYQSGPISGQSTPRSGGGREFRKPHMQSDLGRSYSINTTQKIEELDRRNKNLAKMLEAAVGDLWEYHREQNESPKPDDGDKTSKTAMEALSLAIAKVQFVQVYLEDASIPLPVEEVTEQAANANAVAALSTNPPQPSSIQHTLPTPPPVNIAVSLDATNPKSSRETPTTSIRPTSPPAQRPMPMDSKLPSRPRPDLTSSNFSWILGEDSASSHFAAGAAHSAFSSDEKRRMKGKGFLFGEYDDEEGSTKDAKKGGVSSKSTTKGFKNTKGKHGSDHGEVEEEVIDLNNMGTRGVA